jgi:two-component system chemotaxis response regulator CheB
MSEPSQESIRVLVVDDSSVMRRIVSQALAETPGIEVVGTAVHGANALLKIPELKPDVITLDVEMPEMSGLEALDVIRDKFPSIRVIMCSTLTERGARVTIDALLRGASDYVAKPTSGMPSAEALKQLQTDLVAKVRLHARPRKLAAQPATPASVRRTAPHIPPVVAQVPKSNSVRIVCLGSSTGGPNALAELFNAVRQPLPVPMVIVQHMPPVFTKMLAERLSHLPCRIRFEEGADGMPVLSGTVYLAPGGLHMEVRMQRGFPFLHLHDGPQENFCRPAVDVLFRSVAQAYGGDVLAVILTGMGTDGTQGCRTLASRGARILVQDEASSVVWGMPGSVAGAGLADEVLALSDLGRRLQEIVARHSPRPPASLFHKTGVAA